MTRIQIATLLVSLIAPAAHAQTTRHPFVRALGTGSISVKPDLAKVAVGVVTQAQTAQDAAAQNSTRLNAVMDQLRQVLGLLGDMKTISYTLTPNYNYPQGGGVPTLLGYTATNTIEVTTSDL